MINFAEDNYLKSRQNWELDWINIKLCFRLWVIIVVLYMLKFPLHARYLCTLDVYDAVKYSYLYSDWTVREVAALQWLIFSFHYRPPGSSWRQTSKVRAQQWHYLTTPVHCTVPLCKLVHLIEFLIGYCPACRTTLVATRFWVVMICPIIKCLTVLRVFFYFVWFVFIHHNFQFYFELCTYCNILDIYLS